MHGINSIWNRIFVITFMLLLWVPMLHINRQEKSETENRTLAVMPSLMSDGKINNKYGEEFNTWFNDRFFGRERLISIHNNFMNKIQTGETTAGGNKRVLIGRDNWLFYKEDNSLKNYTNSNTPNEKQMAAGLAYLKDIDAWCRAHNKKFFYLIGPDKNKIYPEYFPTYINKLRPDSDGIGATFYRYIRENSDIDVIYPYDELMAAKETDLVYYTNDTHWNMLGGYIAFRILYQHIFDKEFNENKFIRRWNENSFEGDLAKMLNLKDNTVYMQTKFKEPEFFNDIQCQTVQEKPTDAPYIKCKNPNRSLRVYVLRDSFSIALIPYMAQVFNTVELQWRNYFNKPDLDVIARDYDIVILENVERLTPSVLRKHFPKD